MSRRGVDSFMKSRPDDFWRRVYRGIPQEHRWAVWKCRLLAANCVPYCRETKEREKALLSGPNAITCVAGLLSKESKWNNTIRADAPRTFPELQDFDEEYQESLCRVLNAYVFLNPEVGYVQGMSYVVGFLLLASKCSEHETLFVFVRLMEDCGLNGLYREGFPLLKQYVHIFDLLMDELIPDLSRHFRNEGVESMDYLQQWFMTLFVYCLPYQAALFVWDIVMCNGLRHLVLAALALLDSVKEVLLAKNQEELMQFFMAMKLDEEGIGALEVGRCVSQSIWRLSKLPSVQSHFEVPAEQSSPEKSPPTAPRVEEPEQWSFNLDSARADRRPSALKASSKQKAHRVSFDTTSGARTPSRETPRGRATSPES